MPPLRHFLSQLKDEAFEETEKNFRMQERLIKSFIRDLSLYLQHVRVSQTVCAAQIMELAMHCPSCLHVCTSSASGQCSCPQPYWKVVSEGLHCPGRPLLDSKHGCADCVSLVQESACMKVLAAVSMWDLCTEKGNGDLDQFQKVNRLISDQLFSNFVSGAVLSVLGRPLWGPPCRVTQPERCEHSYSALPS